MWLTFGIIAGAFFAVTAIGGTIAARIASNRGLSDAKRTYKQTKKEYNRALKDQKRLNKVLGTNTQQTKNQTKQVTKTVKKTKNEMLRNFYDNKLKTVHSTVESVRDNPEHKERVEKITSILDGSLKKLGEMANDDNVSVEEFEKTLNSESNTITNAFNEFKNEIAVPAEEVEETEEVEEIEEEEEEQVHQPTKKELKEQAKKLKEEKQKIYDELAQKFDLDKIMFEVQISGRTKENIKITKNKINKALKSIKKLIGDGSVTAKDFADYAEKVFIGVEAYKEALKNGTDVEKFYEEIRKVKAKYKKLEEENEKLTKKAEKLEETVSNNTAAIREMAETLSIVTGEFGKIVNNINTTTKALSEHDERLSTLEKTVGDHEKRITANTARSKHNVKEIKKVRSENSKRITQFEKAVNQRFGKVNGNIQALDKKLTEAVNNLSESLDYMLETELVPLKEQVQQIIKLDQENSSRYDTLIANIDTKLAAIQSQVNTNTTSINDVRDVTNKQETRLSTMETDLLNMRSRFKEKYATLIDLINTKADEQKFVEHKHSVFKQLKDVKQELENLAKKDTKNQEELAKTLADVNLRINQVEEEVKKEITKLTTDLKTLVEENSKSIKEETLVQLENSLVAMIQEKASLSELLALETKLNSLEQDVVTKLKGDLVQVVQQELNDSKSAVRIAIKNDIKTRIDQKFYKNKNYLKMKEMVDNHGKLKEEITNEIMVQVLNEIAKVNRDLTEEEFDKLVEKVADSLIVKPNKK